MRTFINWLFRSDIKDIMTGYRAFGYRFVKTYAVTSSGFEIETEMTIHAVDRNFQVENIVIEYRDRPEGSESKLNTFSDGLKVIRTIVKLYRNYRPMGFFGMIALILAVLSTGFFLPVWVEFLETGQVARFPTLIVCGIVMLMALLVFTSGLILTTLRDQNKRDFEFKLVQAQTMKTFLELHDGPEG